MDELYSSVNNPRGTLADSHGNIWIAGDAYHLYKYNLATMEGHRTPPVSVSTGSFYTLNEGEDGYIYMSTNRGHIVSLNPITEEFKLVCQPLGADGRPQPQYDPAGKERRGCGGYGDIDGYA